MKRKKEKGHWEKRRERFADGTQAKSRAGHLRAHEHVAHVTTETFPRHIELPEAIVVHGMFEPGVPLEEQKDTVVIGTLTGEHYMEKHYAGPWYDHYAGPKPLIVGHHSYLRSGEPLIREGLLYAIDTGCCHGFRLTALILPEFRIVSVPSRDDHWSRMRREFAALAGSGRDDLDLGWETLAAFAESADLLIVRSQWP